MKRQADASPESRSGQMWHVYMILSSDNSLYTGITTDLRRRFDQHASGRGARYFRGRQPLRVVYHESGHTRSSAASRERAIKCLPRAEKLALISSGLNEGSLQQGLQPCQGRAKSAPAN